MCALAPVRGVGVCVCTCAHLLAIGITKKEKATEVAVSQKSILRSEHLESFPWGSCPR